MRGMYLMLFISIRKAGATFPLQVPYSGNRISRREKEEIHGLSGNKLHYFL